MAVTHHCSTKHNARMMAHKLRKMGNKVSINPTKGGWSVTSWKK